MSIKSLQRFFFDSAAVIRAADKQTRGVLSKFGAFVRRTARSSIRKAKKPAPAGKPPHGHGAQLLKKFLFFAYDPAKKSVIIGPAKLGGTIGDAPRALEHGGQSEATRTIRVGRSKYRATRKVTIAPHPYMGPAVAKESRTLPDLWARPTP
jgi:hypothetical protein